MRRFTRRTKAFSKKVANRAYAVALHDVYLNLVTLHPKVRIAPAMATGITDRLWAMSDIVVFVEAADAPVAKRGSS